MKAILITGAGRGIGRAAALRAAEAGWSVAVNYRTDRDAAQAAAAAVRERGVEAVLVPGDVSREADVVEMFQAATAALGPLSGVVVNAGIVGPSQRLAEMSADRLRRMFEVNVLGAYLTAREAARTLTSGGSIVLVSSLAARLGSPGEYVDYAGSKAALDALAVGLAKELAPDGVRVNSVRPGLIETEIYASGGHPDRARRLGVQTPMGRAGLPEEVGEAIVWLLSDAASYVTGATLDVGGGR
ncbi:SDR family oxidoreductase [Caulobacter hibisci]|uniref:SDR family oxidoreductase n=1 Tax=Caulobacter hibisci TaxID=2035993 RepID=A0ABS0SVJ5_9CAUL|nr:SDR family oxidoreductase [Caulobacter hibisci]MBI1683660.1 SDR family oxidoreductase [Caulobacter hibisci]